VTKKIIITGAAGLVGQNLVTRMKDRTDVDLVCIDKHPENCAIFRGLHPDVTLIEADLAQPGDWMDAFAGAACVVINHAQIGALTETPFQANNVDATARVLDAMKAHQIRYAVHISSSVVNSMADDFYTRSKTAQEKMVLDSGIECVVLRPTLMYGWFDRKHLGWLSRFMQSSPVFPIPGHGRYIRQPLYAGDFCAIIEACIDTPRPGQIFDISGREKIFYKDLIRMLKSASGGRARVVHIPYRLFWVLIKTYGLIFKDPPFTTTQLEALVIPEEFDIIDWPDIFGVAATPTEQALTETFQHPTYSKVVLQF